MNPLGAGRLSRPLQKAAAAADTTGMRSPRSDPAIPIGRRLLLVMSLALIALAGAAVAPRALAHDSTDGVPERILDRALGEDATPTEDGLYAVEVRGPDLLTHGPDVRLEDEPQVRGAGFSSGDPERAPACAQGYRQQILYATVAGGADDYAASQEPIRAAVRRMDAVLNQDSLDSGGPTADYRIACDGAGEIQLDSFTAPGTSFGEVVSAARAAGFNDRRTDYTVFLDASGGGSCGIGSYRDDDRLSVDNLSNSGGGYAIAYRPCWFNDTPMHENGHNQGAVQYGAPYSTGDGGHCWDERDVMCYSPDGGDLHQEGTVERCADRTHFDCGYDTYFDSAPEPGEWLQTHWNIGSPLNRFVAFAAAAPTPAANTPPGASFSFSCESLSCEFADTSTDSDGTIATREWSFGDGATATTANPAHGFTATGTYEVTLTVTDDDGAATTTSRQVSAAAPVPAPAPPPAPVTGAPTAPDPPSPPAVTPLRNRVATRSVSGLSGSWRSFSIRVPRRIGSLAVTLGGPGCSSAECDPDLDLYLRRRSTPTLEAFACAPRLVGSTEVCRIRRPRSGRWLISVHAERAAAPAPFSVRAVERKRRSRRR